MSNTNQDSYFVYVPVIVKLSYTEESPKQHKTDVTTQTKQQPFVRQRSVLRRRRSTFHPIGRQVKRNTDRPSISVYWQATRQIQKTTSSYRPSTPLPTGVGNCKLVYRLLIQVLVEL